MFVDCPGIVISIIVKHEQYIGIIKAICLPRIRVIFFGPGEQKKKKMLGYSLMSPD